MIAHYLQLANANSKITWFMTQTKTKKLLISANSEAWAVFKDILRKFFKDNDHMLIMCPGQEHL